MTPSRLRIGTLAFVACLAIGPVASAAAPASAFKLVGANDPGESKAGLPGDKSLKRESVKKETAAARKSGQIPCGEADASQTRVAAGGSETTRAAVKAETLRAKKSGELLDCGEGDRSDRSHGPKK